MKSACGRGRILRAPQVLQFAQSMNPARLAFGRLPLHQISNMFVTRPKRSLDALASVHSRFSATFDIPGCPIRCSVPRYPGWSRKASWQNLPHPKTYLSPRKVWMKHLAPGSGAFHCAKVGKGFTGSTFSAPGLTYHVTRSIHGLIHFAVWGSLPNVHQLTR
jgi:hypothetical protein